MDQEHTHADSPQIQRCSAQQAPRAKNCTELSTFAALHLHRFPTWEMCNSAALLGTTSIQKPPLGIPQLTPSDQVGAYSEAVRIITYILVKERSNLIWMQDRTFCHTCTVPALLSQTPSSSSDFWGGGDSPGKLRPGWKK